jgi:predicted NUDIX family phosphoesterase
MTGMDERVLVIPATHFEAVGAFTGFKPADDRYRADLIDAGVCQFRPRAEVETDPGWKQLIPYVVLRCDGKIFHYRRSGGGETRLNAKRSIGVGGHISDGDAFEPGSPYRNGMRREIFEEVEIDCPFCEVLFGFIYDPATPVGAVHLGIVHLYELAEPKVRPKESGLVGPGFATPDELLADRGSFESWSQLVLDDLVK